MYAASRRLCGGSAGSPLLGLRYMCLRSLSTSFREEKDTFGPILVPSDKFVFSSLIFYCLIATYDFNESMLVNCNDPYLVSCMNHFRHLALSRFQYQNELNLISVA